jgi:drug/metabolite transporter (DMT)-like permease
MVSLFLGIAAATGASALYSLGVGFQSIDARMAGDQYTLRLSLLTHLLRRGRWLIGTAMNAAAWPLQIVALLFAPLEVVQPTLSVGLLFLLAFGERVLGERPGRREKLAVFAIIAGVAGIAALAPERTISPIHGVTPVVVLALLGAGATAPFVAQLIGRPVANLSMVGAGLAFAWGALATKLLSDDASAHHWLNAALWGVGAIVASLIGLTAEMSALQKRAAILVAPVVFVAQTLVPVMLAPLILHESFLDTPLSGVPLLLCLVVLLAGAATIARSPALLALSGHREREAAQAALGDGSGTPESPEWRSLEATSSSALNEPADPASRTTTISPLPSDRDTTGSPGPT